MLTILQVKTEEASVLQEQTNSMIVILMILTLIIVSVGAVQILKQARIRKYTLSFRDSMDLVELPVVTFYHGKKKLNLLLDTGSSESVINSAELDKVVYEELEGQKPLMGIEGNIQMNKVITTVISYSALKFNHPFIAADMSDAFGKIKKETGVTIHGILGSDFFSRYKYILDFDKLMFYKK